MQVARRNLLKTGLMCTGAAAAAGVSLPASAAVEPKSKIAREEWDVVVVGAGFAGLCAALEAKEKGAKVLLIEKMGRPDCTSAYSSGWIAATKTRYQDKDDDDSKELYFKEMMEVSGGRSDPALIRAYAEIAGESVDWLGDHGMTYKIWKQHAPERMRCHIVPAVNGLTGGAHMVKVMLEALEKAGVPVRYNTKAVELVTDECFNVLGVSCIEKHRRVELMTKGGVILATGGFAGNNAMVGQYIGPWASRMVVRGAPWATGENIRMAEQVIARMVNMDQFYAGPISPVGHCNPSPLMHAGYGIQINTDGRRFVQEHLGQIEKAVGIASLTKNNMSYLLIGQDADANNNILSNTLTRFEKLGLKVASGKTIEEAVKQAGLPVEAVMETVAEYNKAVREGKTAELVPPYLNEHPHELKTGPFYLVPAVGGIANTFGGPKIDANARVVNTEDRPIPGLYAAGAAAGGIWYAADARAASSAAAWCSDALPRATPRLVRRRLDREERKYVRHEETGACRRPCDDRRGRHGRPARPPRRPPCRALGRLRRLPCSEDSGRRRRSRHAEVPCLPRLAQRRLRKDPRPRQRPVARPAREPQPRPQLRRVPQGPRTVGQHVQPLPSLRVQGTVVSRSEAAHRCLRAASDNVRRHTQRPRFPADGRRGPFSRLSLKNRDPSSLPRKSFHLLKKGHASR